ncbi:MAG TPA: hypothetical protein VF715_10965 [Thermoleophilaceae bacterium]
MTDEQTARRVLARHRDAILTGLEGAVGVGVGAADGGAAIVVFLEHADNVPEGPAEIEGVPLRYEVTGGFRAF